MEEEVPCYFLCPISLQMMRDPVTLPTGITYDRDGIERWLLTAGTCPLTKQPVPADCEPTPNHTLRRLIQAWCAAHHHQAEAVPSDDMRCSPKQKARPTDRARVASLLSQIDDSARRRRRRPQQDDELLLSLRKLRDVAAESELSRKLIASVPGAVETLVTAIVVGSATTSSSESDRDSNSKAAAAVIDEALEIVSSLQIECLARVVETTNGGALVDALVSALQRSSSREHAARLLADVTAAMSPNRLASLPAQVFGEVVQLLRDNKVISNKPATKAALHVLVGTTSWGRNRVKAVDAGAVAVLVDMLLDEDAPSRVKCELALAALDRLCGCAEGRAGLVAHAAGVAAVGGKALLRVSALATDKAVRVLRSVAKHAATPALVQDMAQTGVVGALCMVAHSEQYADRTRERARETLRLHARAWRTSPCLHRHLQALYPPSC